MTTMSITRALAKLKLLDKRIEKATNACFVDIKIGEKPQNENCAPEANFQKALDLIKYREALKSAVMNANATTTVTINDQTMTIMEAIERKNSIARLEALKSSMRMQLFGKRDEIERINDRAQRRLDTQLEAMVGNKDTSLDAESIQTVTEIFKKENMADLDDPLEIEKKINELDEEIDGFLSEVDLVLSEVNSQTEIEVPYDI